MAPHWAEVVGWISLGVCFATALAILVDEVALGHRQHMWIMNLVHPITALYLGPVWLWAYVRHGRASAHDLMHRDAERLARENVDPERLREEGDSTEELGAWQVGDAASHCGAGCTLGDIGGEWIVWALGMPVLGASGAFGPELIADFVLAWSLGIAFQYFTIVPMREHVGRLEGLRQAIRADTFSILAFQLGLFGWMALAHFVIWQPPLPIASAAHWWMMQVGMVVGYVTSWPVNRWLVRSGIKEKMDRRRHLADMLEGLRDPVSGRAARARAHARGRARSGSG